ncbi:MAG: MFS transporter [Arcobacteraceae bacterium]|nr:MFS transporter [Arcobacteraceae bacterium]
MQKIKNNSTYFIIIGIIFAALTDSFSSGALSFGSFDMQGNLSATNDEFVWLNIIYISFKLIAFMTTPSILERVQITKALKTAILLLVISCFFSTLTTDLHLQYFLRMVQGFSGGVLLISAQTFLFQEFSKKEQPFVQAFFAIGAVIAPATFIAGINGSLIDGYTWEVIYLATIPLGLVSLMILSFVDESKSVEMQIRKFDFIGLILFILFIFPTLYVLYQGNRYNWFDDSNIVILSIISVGSLISFILWQILKRDSLIETKIFKTNSFSFGVVVSLVAGAALFGSGAVFTTFSIQVLGLTLSDSGMLYFYSGFMFFLSVFLTAFIIQTLSRSPFTTIPFGLAGFSFSMYLLSLSSFQSGIDDLLTPMLIRGASMGFLFLALTIIAINALPKHLVAYGLGVFSTTRQLGGTLSIGVLSALITKDNAQNYNILSSNIVENSPNVTDWLNTYANKLTVNTLDEQTTMSLLSKVLNEQVMALSYTNAFWYLIYLIVLAIPCILITKKLLAKFNPEESILSKQEKEI